ncbi:MAG: dihydrolipoyl dehydrogenase [Phycisphaerae bacterium]
MAEQSRPRETQLAVIGAGPGGYAAAFRAADGGMKVTLVSEDADPGGVCLQRGCIPSKALLHVARLIYESREATGWGVRFGEAAVDLNALRAWKDGVVGKLAGGVMELARRRGVEFLHARAVFEDSQTLRLTSVRSKRSGSGEPSYQQDRALESPPTAREAAPAGDGDLGVLRFERAILATGSLPVIPQVFDIGDRRIMDSTDALALPEVPARLLIVGGGYIGLEMATVYAALGSRVAIVEMTDGLLPGVDRDLVRPVEMMLKTRCEAIHLKTKVAAVKKGDAGIVATLQGEAGTREETFDRVLVAIGRRPNSRGIGLEKTQVAVNAQGFVEVDARMRTADPHILAIGDIAGQPLLAHKATHEAKVAVDGLLGEEAMFDNAAVPAVVFTDPEIAWCGLTETQAKAAGREVGIGRFSWAASGRALTLGRTDGLTKILFDPQTRRVLGVGLVGVGAGEMIAEGVLAVEMAAVAHDVGSIIHPHPTLSETYGEAAEAFLGKAIHILARRRAAAT